MLEPDDLELPVCQVDPNWEGFASAAEASPIAFAPITDYPICVADPTQAFYVIGGPKKLPSNPENTPPDPAYRWTGAVTRQFHMGGTVTTQVVDPSTPSGDEFRRFTNSRPLAVESQLNYWIESGWTEDNLYGDARYVYSAQQSVQGYAETVHTAYHLNVGSFYVFRVQEFTTPGGAIAAIWWNGTWNILRQNRDLICEEPEFLIALCYIEELVENVNQGLDTASFPTIPASGVAVGGSCMTRSGTTLLNRPNGWTCWNSDSRIRDISNGSYPYHSCWNSLYNWFRVIDTRTSAC